MFCHNCGKQLKDDSVFCSACGTKVNQTQGDSTAPEVADISTEQINAEPVLLESVPLTEEPITDIPIPTEPIATEEVIPAEDSETIPVPTIDEPIAENPFLIVNPTEQNPEFIQTMDPQTNPNPPVEQEISPIKGKNPRSKRMRITITVSSVVMSIIIGLLVISIIGQFFLTFGVSEENITKAITNVDYETLQVKEILDVEALSEQYDADIPEDATIAQAIYYCIDQNELVSPISEDEVALLVKRLDFEDFFAEKAAKAVRIAKNGSDEQPVTAEELVAFLRDEKNKSYIETTIGIEVLDIDYDYMEQYLKDNNSDYLNALNTENLNENIGAFNVGFLRFYNSIWFIVATLILIIGFAVLIGFLKKRISSSLLYTGVPFVIAGLPTLAFGLLYKSIMPSDFYTTIVSPFMTSFIVISAIVVALGAGMIVGGIVLNALCKRKTLVVTTTPYQI